MPTAVSADDLPVSTAPPPQPSGPQPTGAVPSTDLLPHSPDGTVTTDAVPTGDLPQQHQPFEPHVPAPRLPSDPYGAVIQAAAQKWGVDPKLLRALGIQETGLGTSPLYDPKTGLSKTPGNKGHGLFQLDPASGASEADLQRAATDPAFAADRAAQMLAANLKATHGDVKAALAMYNAGTHDSKAGQDYAHKVLGFLGGAVTTGYHALLTAGTDTMRGMNAVLGAPQRFVAGALTGSGDLAHRLAEGGYLATHPFNEAAQLALNLRTEHLPGVEQASGAVGKAASAFGGAIDKVSAMLGHPTHTAEFLEPAARMFTAQLVTDPLTAVPLVGQLGKIEQFSRLLDGVGDGVRAIGAKVPGLDAASGAVKRSYDAALRPTVQHYFGRRPELEGAGLSANEGVPLRLMTEEKWHGIEDDTVKRITTALRPFQKQISAAKDYGELPNIAKAAQLVEPWVDGTPEMRAEATRLMQSFGYTPEMLVHDGLITAKELHAPPSGAVKYNLREDYLTLINPEKFKNIDDLPAFREVGGKHRTTFSGFEKQRDAEGALPVDKWDLITNRIQMGQRLVAARKIDAETAHLLKQYPQAVTKLPKVELDRPDAVSEAQMGLGLEGVKPAQTAEELERDAAIKKLVDGLSYGPAQHINPLGRFMGSLAKYSVMINPIPHGIKNVGELADIAGGPEAVGRGWAYTAKGLDAAQQERLLTMGERVDYLREMDGPLGKVMQKLTGPQQRLMTRLEMGYRQGLLDQLDREYPHPSYDYKTGTVLDPLLEAQKAERIRQALGDYRNVSRFTSFLQAIGGPFVAFRLGIVPKAVAKGILTRPDRVGRIARAQVDANDELHREGHGGEFNFGGPVEDLSRLAFKPLDYMTSSSTIGPWAFPFAMAREKMGPHEALGEVASQYTPGLSTALPFVGLAPGMHGLSDFPYRPTPGVTPMQEALARVIGSYYSRPVSAKRRRQIKREAAN